MTDLTGSDNIYATLSQSSYPNRKNIFGEIYNFVDLSEETSNNLNVYNHSVPFTFPHAKDAYGNDTSKVYLQPDKLETLKEKSLFGEEKTYQKGLLTDEKAGYNSYYVTDTPKLNSATKHTYFATRGSDGMSLNTLNDWVSNNGSFTLFNAYIPQAKLANKAMQAKISELRKKAPNATMAVAGHSLGTMVSIQAVANLPKEDIAKLDKIVLFQGPDARESINKMSKQAQANIQTLEEQGKIEYYVNAFDIVSMLNRNKKDVDEIGKVHYLLPKSFTTTFDFDAKYGSSHDFGQYQINADGTLKEANLNEHGYIFAAGIKISHLIDKYLDRLVKSTGANVSSGKLLSLLLSDGALYAKFQQEYQAIVNEAKLASQWQGKVTSLQQQLTTASGSQKIALQEELAQTVATKARDVGEEYATIFKNAQQELEDEITSLAQEIAQGAYALRKYLSDAEIEEMIAPYTKERLWDNEQATQNRQLVRQYQTKTANFSKNLLRVAKNIQEDDAKASKELFKN